ncbi:MAG: methyltransferase domain-containing protein [Chloroflexi bacterium]|nr:methyltransferase domain-containing protein [Chloroflexota bacterium]MBL7061253.1 methyltransferase domain-containing protein [Dehalococcoidia bacterium]
MGKTKKISSWEPKDYESETTTVWSFRQRGCWATHDGRYRGNWSPYIPRNVILKYSQPGDTVLDYFVGGGTTAVEAKLLGRRCIGLDINAAAIELTKGNLHFDLVRPPDDYQIYEPIIKVGDARNLEGVEDNTIDLICAHPPYAGIISYSSKIDGDLSSLSYDAFIDEMHQVAEESYRVLTPGGKCAILIGDSRNKKHVVPIGFRTINAFLDAKFKLKELVIKRQHNCKTTGFWYSNSIKHNFLLLAHEYLAIFEKPRRQAQNSDNSNKTANLMVSQCRQHLRVERVPELETTSVWILPEKEFEEKLNKNVICRYSEDGEYWQVLIKYGEGKSEALDLDGKTSLLFMKSPSLGKAERKDALRSYEDEVYRFVRNNINRVKTGGFLVVQTRDVRIGGCVEAVAKRLIDILRSKNLWLKEIVVLTSDGVQKKLEKSGEDLDIVHQYLLIFEVLN